MNCTWLTIFELLSATIKETATGNWTIAYVTKRLDTQPNLCGKEMTLEEKIKSTISQNCITNTLAINVVIETDACLTSGNELPCNTVDMTFEERLAKTIVLTTDGDYAFLLTNITGPE